ncbi:MAG: 30S ribosomal protein S14 [Bacteroidetes bacterium]|nr:30S ribosomal protein S14 [Bacteroidota bacterium]
MAKESMKAREVKRKKLGDLYAERREQLKKEGKWDELQKLPRNSSKVRQRNRCKLTGRPRGYMRTFGISRVTFREMAVNGLLPGVTKCSF